MLIDITLPLTRKLLQDAKDCHQGIDGGHIGTHFDVMDKQFPLTDTCCEGWIFDVRSVTNRDIELADIDESKVKKGMFVGFCSGFMATVGYGKETYFNDHPQLSEELINFLLKKEVALIGMDFAGIRRGTSHQFYDQKCADLGVFNIENLSNMEALLSNDKPYKVHTYPLNLNGWAGLPCRVIVETAE